MTSFLETAILRFSKEEMMRNALVPLQAIAERLGFQLSQVREGGGMHDGFCQT